MYAIRSYYVLGDDALAREYAAPSGFAPVEVPSGLCVLSGFNDFIQVADGTGAHSHGQGAIGPDRLAGANQIATDQIGGA